MNKLRYAIASVVMLLGFLPMMNTALATADYITLFDYTCATAGFLLAVHITKQKQNGKESEVE